MNDENDYDDQPTDPADEYIDSPPSVPGNDSTPEGQDAVESVDAGVDSAPEGEAVINEDVPTDPADEYIDSPPSVPGNEERASRLSTGEAPIPESLSEDRFRQSSDEPYKDHGDRHEGPSSKHSDDDNTESKIDTGFEEVAPGVQGRSTGQHGGVEASDTGTGSNQ